MTILIVNGRAKELRYDVDGIDISGDFIGNTAHGMVTDDEGRYIATEDDFTWWRDTIAAHQEMDALIARCKESNDPDLVDQVVQDWGSGDLDDIPKQVILGLTQTFE